MSKTLEKYRLKEAVVDGLASADIITALGYTPGNVANKKTSLADNSDTYYPSQKAVKTAVDLKADTGTDDTWASTSSGQLPLLLEIDFHYQIDTIGSRDTASK